MSNQPALAPSGRLSRSRVRVSRTRRGPAKAPDRMNGMITPWSVGTPRKATRASSRSRSSTAGAPKNVRVAGRVSGPTGCSASPGIPTSSHAARPKTGLASASASWYNRPRCGRNPEGLVAATARWLVEGGEAHEATADGHAVGSARVGARDRGLRRHQQRIGNESVVQGIGDASNEPDQVGRSEEHTSELQSLTNLVCRLLLEKKKKKNKRIETKI